VLDKQSRLAHAKQMNRARGCMKKMRTYLGVIRDSERKSLFDIARRIRNPQRKDTNKIYSAHEPTVACISKGKAHKRYEFGCKVSVAATSRGGWFAGAKALHGNPYDGHTLKDVIRQVERIARPP
jgi:IS5 family transposase